MVPADGNFTVAIQKGDHKKGEVQGQTRQHARLINLLGVKQLICCVNKMDTSIGDHKPYAEARFDEIKAEMQNVLKHVGWPPNFVEKKVPILPSRASTVTTFSPSPPTCRGGRARRSRSTSRPPWLSTPSSRVSTTSCSLLPVTPRRPCVSPSLASTRSRVSVMCSPAVSSRVTWLPVRRSSSSRPTPPPPPALARSSPSRCTTSASKMVASLATTLA